MDEFYTVDQHLSIEQRWQCLMLPLGKHIYNGLGFILPNKKYWNKEKFSEMVLWSQDLGIYFDGPVICFPDWETVMLFKMTWC